MSLIFDSATQNCPSSNGFLAILILKLGLPQKYRILEMDEAISREKRPRTEQLTTPKPVSEHV